MSVRCPYCKSTLRPSNDFFTDVAMYTGCHCKQFLPGDGSIGGVVVDGDGLNHVQVFCMSGTHYEVERFPNKHREVGAVKIVPREVCDIDDYGDLPEAAKKAIHRWIAVSVVPAKTVAKDLSSYALKHRFEPYGFYVTNGQFKAAMREAGYEPTDENEQNWKYKIRLSAHALTKYAGGPERLDDELDRLVKEAKRFFNPAVGGYDYRWWMKDIRTPKEDNAMKPFVKLFMQDESGMPRFGLQTNISEEQLFWDHLCRGLGEQGSDGLRGWLPLAFEVVAKMRGYKAEVAEYRIISAGQASWDKSGSLFADTTVLEQAPLTVAK